MTDRELLERAARAAGLDLGEYYHSLDGNWCRATHSKFDPLEDDGDAFRLTVALELNVFHASGNAYAMPSDFEMDNEQCVSYRDAGGREQATRRAIVRAAAAMVDS